MRQNFITNFLCIIIAYLLIPSLVSLAFPGLIPQRYYSIFQIFIFLFPVVFLAKQDKNENIFINLRLNANINARTILMLLWGLVGLSAFTKGWHVLQDNLMPEYFKSAYSSDFSGQMLQQEILTKNQSGTIYEFLLTILFVAIIPALCEEFLFRAYLLHNLERTAHKLRAILLSALIFTVIHFNIPGSISIFVIGIYLASIVIATNSLMPAIIFHFLNNILIIIITNYYTDYVNAIFQPSLIKHSILSAIGLLIMYISYKKLKTNTGN